MPGAGASVQDAWEELACLPPQARGRHMNQIALDADMSVKCELYRDNFQNFHAYNIPKKAQLVIADIPYNIGTNAYGSSPLWWEGGDRHNGASDKAGKAFFGTDFNFNIAEYFHFCNRLLARNRKNAGKRPV